jgi:hypothetical protein
MSDTLLAALITGAATLIVGLIGGASAAYFALRQQKETALQQKETALAEAQRREDEAQRREDEARRQAEKAHRREAVAYLMSIAEAIRGIREQLAQSEIPYDFGHEFIGLLGSEDSKYYEGLLQPYLGAETQTELKKLRWVQAAAERGDDDLVRAETVNRETLRKMLAEMQRVEGDVRGQARRISPTESRAN